MCFSEYAGQCKFHYLQILISVILCAFIRLLSEVGKMYSRVLSKSVINATECAIGEEQWVNLGSSSVWFGRSSVVWEGNCDFRNAWTRCSL